MALREKLTYTLFKKLHIEESKSLQEIGDAFGVSRQRIHQLKKEYEKKHGKLTRRVFIDIVTLKHYLDLGWTAKQIADHFEMQPSKVCRMIRKYKEAYELGVTVIAIKRKTAKDFVTKKELKRLYEEELCTDKEIAKLVQLSPSTIGMLRKKYGIETLRTKKLRKLPNELTKERFLTLYKKLRTVMDVTL
jgi:DNA-directed RNA polymerase sigma subunit (sigma70/sigma32)